MSDAPVSGTSGSGLPEAPAGLRAFSGTAAEARRLAVLSVAAFGAEALTARAFRDRLRYGHARLLGLRSDGEIIAYLLLYLNRRTRRAYVNEVVVVPDWRGRGLSHWLLAAAEAAARQEGMVTLAAHARASNTPSLRAKMHQGLSPTERLPGWYPDGEEAIYLRRTLEPGAALPGRSSRRAPVS